MSFKGVLTSKLNGGLGRRNPSSDGVAILIIGAAVAATGLAIKTLLKTVSLGNVEAVGITAAYDDTNSILAHHHADEFYRLSPDGTLYILLDDGSLTDTELKAILRRTPDIKFAGVVRNIADVVTNAIVLSTVIGQYQTIVSDLKSEGIDFDGFLIEGHEFTPATLATAYTNLRALTAPNVSVVIAQDPQVRAVKAAYNSYAAIGTALGMLSVRRVNENLGSVDIERKPSLKKGNRDYPLSDGNLAKFLSAGLQNGASVDAMSLADKKALTALGYIYAASYQGYAGIFFNNSPTCVEAISDFAYIENNRVWNKASRLMKDALMPRIKGNLLKDPTTGFIRDIEAKELETVAERALKAMVSDEEISGAAVYINPAQSLSELVPLIIKVSLIINEIIYEINVELGLTTKA